MTRRVLWHSAPPWAPTSIGSQTALMARSLDRAGFEVLLSTYVLDWGGTTWEGLPVLPGASPSLGRWADELVDARRGDRIVTLTDAWRLYVEDVRGRPVLSWTPMESEPLDPEIAEHFRNTGTRPVAVSGFGARQYRDAGLADVAEVPHGVDVDVFRPLLPGDRAASRAAARRSLGIDEDRYVVGVVGTNGPAAMNRKSYPEILDAVARAAERVPNLTLYLHTRLDTAFGGFPLDQIVADRLAGRVEVRSTSVNDYMRGLPTDGVAELYNAFDVLCIPSAGEGFCLAMLEAQACGVPVVASDRSAQPENFAIGRLVGGTPRPDPSVPGSTLFTPSVPEIADALVELAEPDAVVWTDGVDFATERSHERRFRELWLPLLDEG